MIGVPNCTPIARILPRVEQRFNGQSVSETLYIHKHQRRALHQKTSRSDQVRSLARWTARIISSPHCACAPEGARRRIGAISAEPGTEAHPVVTRSAPMIAARHHALRVVFTRHLPSRGGGSGVERPQPTMDELLHAFAVVDLGGVEIPLRVHGQVVNPLQLAGSASVADGANLRSPKLDDHAIANRLSSGARHCLDPYHRPPVALPNA